MAFSTIDKSTLYQNTVLYDGDGTDARGITGVGFQPDLTLIKQRDDYDRDWIWTDAVRAATKTLRSNTTAGESTDGSYLQSFNADGFTIGDSVNVNNSSGNNYYAAWNWKANGSGSANTDGDIASTVSVNTTSGFSIVTYTGTGVAGATIGHGLATTPAFIIVKCLSATQPWRVYHGSLGADYALILNNTIAKDDDTTAWNDTEPTSSVFSAGTTASINGSGSTYVAYCFAEIAGYSKFGSYKGNNGGSDGPFVYTAFAPQLVIQKLSSHAGANWYVRDIKRDTYNTRDNTLRFNTNTTESSSEDIDFLSNGFKCRANGLNQQDNGYTYLYMAFGQPIISNSGVSANAR